MLKAEPFEPLFVGTDYVQGVLTNVTDKALVMATEENGAAFILALGRAAGAEERNDKVHWVIGNSPIDYHNAVFTAKLSEAEAEQVIAQSLARLRVWGIPGSWHIGPSMRPADLGKRLLAAGFVHDGNEVGMAVDLNTLSEGMPVPADFTLERVRDEKGLATWTQTLGSGFGEGPLAAVTAESTAGAELWAHYLNRWSTWNHVRTVSSLTASAGFMLALLRS